MQVWETPYTSISLSKVMRAIIMIAVIAIILGLDGAMAALKSCRDDDCSSGCITDTTAPGACKTASDASAKYVCVSGNVSIMAYTISDCSGSPASILPIGKEGVCYSYGHGSFYATCGGASACSGTVLLVVAAVVAALLL